jgi:hypothetical protein
MLRRLFLLLLAASITPRALELQLPNKPDSLRFAVIGDTGTGDRGQYDVAEMLSRARATFPYEFVLMLGDNIYGGEKTSDFEKKFERPYKALLDADVKFYAALGNHDEVKQSDYKPFNMGGKRFYTFKPKDGIRFFALDSNYLDPKQLQWLDDELGKSGSEWKICFFHHPLYSSGDRHGPSMELRAVLEPLFVKHNVSVVLSGHEHFYERIKPQRGIYYFISGSGGKLRRGNIRTNTGITAKGFDQDLQFMLMEINGDELYFQTISRTGQTVDSGVIRRQSAANRTPAKADTVR